MDNDRILKKSIFGGFNKSDVLGYIEKLQHENTALADELHAKSEECADLKSVQNEAEVLKRQNSELAVIKSALSAKAEQVRSLEAELATMNEKYAELESKCEAMTGTGNNALIQNAMRYSDSLVSSAKETADRVIADAGLSLNSAKGEIRAAGKAVSDAGAGLNSSFDALNLSVENLVNSLGKYSEKLTAGE